MEIDVAILIACVFLIKISQFHRGGYLANT
jgi:hypothetical protein